MEYSVTARAAAVIFGPLMLLEPLQFYFVKDADFPVSPLLTCR